MKCPHCNNKEFEKSFIEILPIEGTINEIEDICTFSGVEMAKCCYCGELTDVVDLISNDK